VDTHYLPGVETYPHAYPRASLGICGIPHDYVNVAMATPGV
jgi:hypothetical protein